MEDEAARRAVEAVGSADGSAQRDDAPAVAHLRAENARLRGQLSLAWKQVQGCGCGH